MEELLKQLLGKKIDVTCGTNAAFRGDVVDVKSGVLYLRDEDDKVAYVAIDKIAVVYESADHPSRPGFIV
ncbi:MAG TPA: MM0924 family protein [Pyrinomonadaceae bacterium]|nr:MM0924 family protein [Pyrinomonadaceae bacterium]